jgi:hypothetical protein
MTRKAKAEQYSQAETVRRALDTPAKPMSECIGKGKQAANSRMSPLVIGTRPPPGFRWKISGKWPHPHTQDTSPGTGPKASQPTSSVQRLKTEKKERHNSRRQRQRV